ncbi:hypothetical protein CRENBAI_004676 [Crenichthys baileyi]|uniref:Uncharacterized protein n=1 Tax=Crenichthys baileyi TaxID=28760 RepID=A0AAV9QUA9_9TELE
MHHSPITAQGFPRLSPRKPLGTREKRGGGGGGEEAVCLVVVLLRAGYRPHTTSAYFPNEVFKVSSSRLSVILYPPVMVSAAAARYASPRRLADGDQREKEVGMQSGLT